VEKKRKDKGGGATGSARERGLATEREGIAWELDDPSQKKDKQGPVIEMKQQTIGKKKANKMWGVQEGEKRNRGTCQGHKKKGEESHSRGVEEGRRMENYAQERSKTKKKKRRKNKNETSTLSHGGE